jgi:SAM-dependent methyltransferase
MKLPLTTLEKEKYSEYWQSNSATFEDQGCYRWMADCLMNYTPSRILDIGCGTGEGILNLLGRGVGSITCLEENFNCIKTTERKLQERGIEVTVIPRLGYSEDASGRHDLVLDDQDIPISNTTVTLIHADPILHKSDAALTNFLNSCEHFDAITVWLIGTFKNRNTCKALDALPITSGDQYRLCLQNVIYDLSEILLNPEGVLHIVDRVLKHDVEFLKTEALKSHNDQASVTSLTILDDFKVFCYEEPKTTGISMTKRTESGGSIVTSGKMLMQSTFAQKPNQG